MLIAENCCAALFVSTVSPDSETAALQCGRPVSIVTDASVRVERVGRAALAKIVERSHPVNF
jgi:hypothetical protein